MATIDEVFEMMETTVGYTDANEIIYIDPVNRRMELPENEVILGVVKDNRAERKYFSCPAVVGNNIKLTKCNVHINYINADGQVGCYCASDMRTNGTDVLFSWEVSSKAAAAAGLVRFIVCICEEVDGEVIKEWHTTLGTARVLEGIDGSVVPDEDIETDSDIDNPDYNASARLGTAILGQMILGQV